MASSVPAEESKMTGLNVVTVQPGRKTERCSQRAKSTIASGTIVPQGCLRSTFGGRRKAVDLGHPIEGSGFFDECELYSVGKRL